jgi:hypothetical protein
MVSRERLGFLGFCDGDAGMAVLAFPRVPAREVSLHGDALQLDGSPFDHEAAVSQGQVEEGLDGSFVGCRESSSADSSRMRESARASLVSSRSI